MNIKKFLVLALSLSLPLSADMGAVLARFEGFISTAPESEEVLPTNNTKDLRENLTTAVAAFKAANSTDPTEHSDSTVNERFEALADLFTRDPGKTALAIDAIFLLKSGTAPFRSWGAKFETPADYVKDMIDVDGDMRRKILIALGQMLIANACNYVGSTPASKPRRAAPRRPPVSVGGRLGSFSSVASDPAPYLSSERGSESE